MGIPARQWAKTHSQGNKGSGLNTRHDDVEHKACVQCHHAESESALAPPRTCIMYCRECTSTRETVETKMWNKIVILFSLCKKYSRGFVKLQLTDWCHMDYFFDHLGTFLDLGTDRVYERVRELSDSNKNCLICVPKMNILRVWNDMRVSNYNDKILIFGWTIPSGLFKKSWET